MKFVKVESSNIDAIAHDDMEMYVEFKSGAVYAYDKVTKGIYHEIVNADSVGSAFNRLVKINPELYPFRRLT